MATARRLTDAGLQRIKRPAEGRLEVWDALAPGLAARIGSRKTAWIVMYRLAGRQRRMTIGSFPALSVADARERAREVQLSVDRGADPALVELGLGDDRRLTAKTTVRDAVAEYLERYARPRQRSYEHTESALRLSLVALHGHRPIGALTRVDIAAMMDRATANGVSVAANRKLAHTRRFFNWLVERGVLAASPVVGIKPPAKEIARDRILSDDEIVAVWRAAEEDGYPFGPLVQLLLLTGQRRSEVAGLRWDELDLAAAAWTLDAARTKSDRMHQVPLSPPALAILTRISEPGRTGPLVFPSQAALDGEQPVSGFRKAKERLDARSGVTGWRLHDLRRTAASGMARLAFDPHVVERVLNHATSAAGPLARVYQRYSYEAEKRAALDAWGAHVEALVSAPPQPGRRGEAGDIAR